MINMFYLSVVDHGFYPQLGQTKDSNFGICCSLLRTQH